MLRLPKPVRRVARTVVTSLPEPVVAAVPHPIGERLVDVRAVARERADLPPGDVPADDNVAYNRQLWDWYADRWADPEFRRRQLAYEGRAGDDPAKLTRLGEEWGRLDDARQVIDEWVLPFVDEVSEVAEIGTGGGRIARMVAPAVGHFTAFDISARMIELVRAELADIPGASFEVLADAALPARLTDRLDFVYSFDVFVHLDLHTQWRYLQEIQRVLRPGGRAFLHTADLTTRGGWERFAGQGGYRVEGFYFLTPEAVRTLVARAGLEVVRQRTGGETPNFYYDRDGFVIVAKPG